MSNTQARVEDVFQEALRLIASKNASYGDSWREQGWRGNVSRVLEKSKRIRALLWRPSVLLNGSSEHPRETMLDMINTLAFAIINMDDGVEWGGDVDGKPVQPPYPSWTQEQSSEDRFGHVIPPEVAHALAAQADTEQTVIQPVVPTPGEEKPSPKRRNVKVTDRGSGPRRVADTQQ